MISIKQLFEIFLAPWSSQNKFQMKKKKLPHTPTIPNQSAISRIKKLNSKLSNITKR